MADNNADSATVANAAATVSKAAATAANAAATAANAAATTANAAAAVSAAAAAAADGRKWNLFIGGAMTFIGGALLFYAFRKGGRADSGTETLDSSEIYSTLMKIILDNSDSGVKEI